MKKYSIYAVILVLAISLAACRMDGGNESTTRNTTNAPTTATPTIIPSMPTVETNIPDPSVDTGHLGDTEGMDGTGTGATDGMDNADTNGSNDRIGPGRSGR